MPLITIELLTFTFTEWERRRDRSWMPMIRALESFLFRHLPLFLFERYAYRAILLFSFISSACFSYAATEEFKGDIITTKRQIIFLFSFYLFIYIDLSFTINTSWVIIVLCCYFSPPPLLLLRHAMPSCCCCCCWALKRVFLFAALFACAPVSPAAVSFIEFSRQALSIYICHDDFHLRYMSARKTSLRGDSFCFREWVSQSDVFIYQSCFCHADKAKRRWDTHLRSFSWRDSCF